MAVDLSAFKFAFSVYSLPDRDRAILAVVVDGDDEQLAEIAGPRANEFVAEANKVSKFISTLAIAEPEVGFSSVLERLRFLVGAAIVEVDHAFPGLDPDVLWRAGNRYAFLNR
ncbi:hypothetical protein [Demequina aurantiaca]|uniref:hypothetical protein n=1 Tax=Demequina aurantiaca TaxID=676200 RepID=UPI003D336892